MRAKFFVVRKIKSIDKVLRNVGLMTRDKVRCGMRCAKKDACEKSEKERKRAKKSERADGERKSQKFFRVFFLVRVFCSFSSLSLSSLSDALLKEQTPWKGREEEEVNKIRSSK